MLKENEKQTDIRFTESPTSFNTKFKTKEGFICQITLRDDKWVNLHTKSKLAIQELLVSGCIPFPSNPSNGSNGSSPHPGAWCEVHGTHMRRWEKDGRTWFSHKVNGEWCNGGKR